MPDQLEGPTLAAAIALEVMGWHEEFLEGDCNRMKWFWCRSDRQAVHLVDEWRPDTDPTTFFRDVVPAVEEEGWAWSIEGKAGFPRRATFLNCRGTEGTASRDVVATAGCLAALAAVRSRKAAETAEEETDA